VTETPRRVNRLVRIFLYLEPIMGRPRRFPEGPSTLTVRVEADVVRDAKLVAASRGIDLAAYMSAALRVVVARDLKKIEKGKTS
jgi:hypothetical protein